MRQLAAARLFPAPKLRWFVGLWAWVSAMYYIQTLFYGYALPGSEPSALHQGFKYAVLLGLATLLIIHTRRYVAASLLLLVGVQIAYAALWLPTAKPVMDVYIIVLSMSCLPLLLSSLDEDTNRCLPRVLVLTGAVVGCLSLVEITALNYLFQSHWGHTGGMRSISTLLNPNNHGLYMAACSIFLLTTPYKPLQRLLLGTPIATGLVLSGSRTAWAALVVTVLLSHVISQRKTGSTRDAIIGFGTAVRLVAFAVPLYLGWMLVSEYLSDATDVAFAVRSIDTETAGIRLRNLGEYLSRLGADALLPDFRGENHPLVTDSSYLILFNAFGAIAGAITLMWFGLVYRLDFRIRRPATLQWNYVVVLYLVASLTESMINAFPNNQMLFIALGSCLSYRFQRPATARHASYLR